MINKRFEIVINVQFDIHPIEDTRGYRNKNIDCCNCLKFGKKDIQII